MRKLGMSMLLIGGFLVNHAQVSHTVNRDSIRIGEQFTYSIFFPSDSLMDRPLIYTDSIGPFTVVESTRRDSLDSGIRLSTILTAFDSGLWLIPDTTLANTGLASIPIYVNTVPVDTSKAFRDIYGIKEVSGKSSSSWWWLSLLLLIPLIWVLYRYLKNKEKTPVKTSAVQTPYQKAMSHLNQIQQSKAWEDEEHLKEYYAEITDVMRRYFQEEYGVHAMESTSSELMDRIRKHNKINQRRDDIQWVLKNADLAKFAKTRPSEAENREALDKVKFIIKWTRNPKKEQIENSA